jgi:hypothetical protein
MKNFDSFVRYVFLYFLLLFMMPALSTVNQDLVTSQPGVVTQILVSLALMNFAAYLSNYKEGEFSLFRISTWLQQIIKALARVLTLQFKNLSKYAREKKEPVLRENASNSIVVTPNQETQYTPGPKAGALPGDSAGRI